MEIITEKLVFGIFKRDVYKVLFVNLPTFSNATKLITIYIYLINSLYVKAQTKLLTLLNF